MPPKHNKAVVIGAGIGGLATAALLGKEGYHVTVLEKNSSLGGRAMTYTQDGFTFDMGPSWYLMPEVFERFFSLFNKKVEDLYTLKRLDPQYRISFKESPQEYVDIHKDLDKNMEVFEHIARGSSSVIQEYLDLAKYQYDIAMNQFVYKNYDSLLDIIDPRLMIEGTKLRLFKTLNDFISQYTNNEKIKKILQYTMVFLGGSPNNTPAFYSIMSHIDFHLGVYYPMGGMIRVIQALEQMCTENGVTLHTSQEVTRIQTRNGHATQVHTTEETWEADVVISNADYPHTEISLLDEQSRAYSSEYWERKTMAPSCFLLYLGVRGKVPHLLHHNLFFADKWEKHFSQIFDIPCWPEDPSYYLCCPSKTDPTVAPAKDDNIFVLVPVASGLQDDDSTRERYAETILTDIEKQIGESLRDRILVQKIVSQRDYISLYNAYKGTALGLAHTLFQTALFRPKNRSSRVSNLYYAGQYTHPGIGVPMCLISAELTVQRLVQDF